MLKMPKNIYMDKIGEKAKIASQHLSNISIDKRNSVLKQFSQYIKTNSQLILNSNKKDISDAKSKKIEDSMIDRLILNNKKIAQIRNSIEEIIKFKDPLGKTLSAWKRPNDLIIKRVSLQNQILPPKHLLPHLILKEENLQNKELPKDRKETVMLKKLSLVQKKELLN